MNILHLLFKTFISIINLYQCEHSTMTVNFDQKTFYIRNFEDYETDSYIQFHRVITLELIQSTVYTDVQYTF